MNRQKVKERNVYNRSVPCPTCGAREGQPCVIIRGPSRSIGCVTMTHMKRFAERDRMTDEFEADRQQASSGKEEK